MYACQVIAIRGVDALPGEREREQRVNEEIERREEGETDRQTDTETETEGITAFFKISIS